MASEAPKTLDSTRLFTAALGPSSPGPPFPLPPIPSDIPLSKLIPKTRFLVDAFRHVGDHSISYFLSHFHSDHYTGLAPNWCKGIIFCSRITSRLLVEVLKVPDCFVVSLPLSETVLIDGCEVTLIDANHCPGAVQFLFKIPIGDGKLERYVHTGDFRFCDSMRGEPFLKEFVGCDAIFLDTTYCNPKFVFPPQEESIDYIVSAIEKVGSECRGSAEKVLFLIATYVIGKERILLEVARRRSCKVYVDGRKMMVLSVLGYGNSGLFTEDECESCVHVVGWNILGETWPYFRPNFVKMREILMEKGYDKVVGFVPTGWTYEVKRDKFAVRTKDPFEIHLVPYSEHSNYDELREFVRFLKPKHVFPTVGLDVEKLDSKHLQKLQKHFAGLVNETANKRDFLMNFGRVSSEHDEVCQADLKLETDAQTSAEDACENSSVASVFDGSSVQEEQGLPNLLLQSEAREEVLQELRACLPAWATRDQMLDLISTSGSDIIEAASNFYERETDFYRQVSASLTTSSDASVSVSTPSSAKSNPARNMNFLSSRAEKATKTIQVKKSPSLGKKKSVNENPKRKRKIDAKLEPLGSGSGSRQSRITSFFTKKSPAAPLGCVVGTESLQSIREEDSSSNPVDEKIDKFLQIINGNESSRNYAASILEKAKGDINKALDLYYANPVNSPSHDKGVLEIHDSAIQTLSTVDDSSSSKIVKTLPENSVNIPAVPIEEAAAEHEKNCISLPPEKYDPVLHACWRSGQPAPYIHLARTFELVEREKGKIKATSMLCNMFRSLLALSLEDVLPVVYLCTNKIASDHENMELNIGGSLVTTALEEACGVKRSKIRDMYNKLGDLGDVAQECRQTQTLLASPSPLLIKDVFSELKRISLQTGGGRTIRKRGIIVKLMRSCREMEMKFLVRTLVRNLRIGAMMRTILPALAQAVVMNSTSNFHCKDTTERLQKMQSLSAAVIEAYNILPSLDVIVPSLMKEGVEFSSSTLSMTPGIPIKPMLAKITNGIPSVVKLFQNRAFTCEYKYDGQRAQIHKSLDGSIRIFSRNGDETTSRFPDVVAIINESCKASAMTFVLDAEIVAVDRNRSKLMSFQELSSRERGSRDSSIPVDSIKVEICVFVFDIMFANGEQLLSFPLRERRKYLMELFNDEKRSYFEYAKQMTVEGEEADLSSEATVTKINSFLEDALRSSCEGIMVKSLDDDAGYSPSKRSDSWLKVKRDYVEGLSDSLDLVPIGAWHGNGRKAGWYSPFLMACYNPEAEEYQSVCRVMSGFSDSFYIEMKEFFSGDRILSRKPPYYKTGEVPDVWFSSEVVWEIRGADFTVSPVHQAAIGLVHPSRGISVRFPRFIRRVSDRNPDECSTAADVAEMFQSQSRKMDVTGGRE
ncbi:DNA ligase 6 isoform X1 [Punica granatum]|uniref:DNA ligase n=1 Tax=Punica granatum TaxID=22663 RepID=A0A6P8DTX2_PUNGR|nr:DNA ligase 6 isoform X1 [Punica granatum]